MARRTQLLGDLEHTPGKRKAPSDPNQSPRYPPEVKAKAYAAFLDGASWADCARAIGHPDPNGAGMTLITRWANDDRWTRSPRAGDYKSKVEQERASDPQRISNEIDELCVEMQAVSAVYIQKFRDPETGDIVIDSSFKTRDWADMAAALRMIHETRLKIRKEHAPKDDGKDGKKGDFISVIREAGLNRLKDNKRRASAIAIPQEDPDDVDPEPGPEAPARPAAALPSVANIRERLEAAAREGGGEAGSVASDSGADGQC